MIVHFLSFNDQEKLELCAAEITESEFKDGFYTDRGFIPSFQIFDSETEGLEVLRRHAEEIGASVHSVLN